MPFPNYRPLLPSSLLSVSRINSLTFAPLFCLSVLFSIRKMEEGEFDKVDCSFNDELSEAEKSSTFSELKAYGIELLQILQNPNKHSSSLTSFLNFLQNSPHQSLQSFFE